MKFSTHCFRVCLFSTHTILRTSKSIGNNTMKKMLLLLRLALLITGCAQQTFTVQNKPAAVAPETITHHFFVSGIERKTVDAAKICGGAEGNDCAFQKPLLGIRKWIARFYYFRHLYSAGSACPELHELPIDMGNSIYCSLIYFWVPSSCFCIVISLSLVK